MWEVGLEHTDIVWCANMNLLLGFCSWNRRVGGRGVPKMLMSISRGIHPLYPSALPTLTHRNPLPSATQTMGAGTSDTFQGLT